ncbi:MAG: hypothetical protein PHI68_01640 [Candidatus Cloacimonetes bacterium]|nr:hypothetical protein [Candidatus Cloacimonadota bacterium]
MNSIIPKISGLYTLPWIVVGFIVTNLTAYLFSQERINLILRKIGLILLYLFVPVLIFRIFLDAGLGIAELEFVFIVIISIVFMYLIALFYARIMIKSLNLEGVQKAVYLKTMFTNQGRSSAFVGGIMLVIPSWAVPTGIFMAVSGVALFAVIPYLLHRMHAYEHKGKREVIDLPWFLKVYPFYFIAFVIAGILVHKFTGLSSKTMGDWGVALRFFTALTIPAALFYVGSGIHPSDMKKSEIRKLLGIDTEGGGEHWPWVRHIFVLTAIITPAIYAVFFGFLLLMKLIPPAWFAVFVINAILPITSTNMFLVPYGLDKRVTAHSVTWSTLICTPVVVLLIWIFGSVFV